VASKALTTKLVGGGSTPGAALSGVSPERGNARSADGLGETLPAIDLVVVCDDRELVRAGVCHLLIEMDLVGRVAGFGSIEEACAEPSHGATRDGVAILGGGSVEELREPDRRADLGLPAILLLPSDDPYELRAAAELAAEGYILEASLSGRALRRSLELLVSGQTPMPREMGELLLRGARPSSPALRITPRQQDVLQQIAVGATNSVIADKLGVSVHTVKRDVAALLTAMGCANRTEVTAKAMRQGLVPRSSSG
jgi:two-component system nitrate/nitrite response regulator NarL